MRRFAWLLLAACGCGQSANPPGNAPVMPVAQVASATVPVRNWIFEPASDAARRTPTVTMLPLPELPGAAAIWGSLGRDAHGRILFGVSSDSSARATSWLLQYDPSSRQFGNRGTTVGELQRLNKPGISQNKIHTKFWQAQDGFVYFASMDEAGEVPDGSKLPTHGSHLWRWKPGMGPWDHVAAVPEGVIASAVSPKAAYFLGYFGQVVIRFDFATRRITKTRIGAPGGHISRNFVADPRDHVYVPRVRGGEATLVELNGELEEVASVPLRDYTVTATDESHGLVGIAALKSGGWIVATDRGRLIRIEPGAGEAAATCTDLGFLHAEGASYPHAMFSPDGDRWLGGIVNRVVRGEPKYEWVTFELLSGKRSAVPMSIPAPAGARDILVYGSVTRDEAGRYYLGGRCVIGPGRGESKPLAWQVVWK